MYRADGTTNKTRATPPLWLFGTYIAFPRYVQCMLLASDLHNDVCHGFYFVLIWHAGDGLSYTSWNYSSMTLSATAVGQCDNLTASVTVTNTGNLTGAEVAQLYVSIPSKAMRAVRPLWQLAGLIRRVRLLLRLALDAPSSFALASHREQ